MKEILTPYALELVYLLTNQDEEDTLYKLKSVLSGKSKSTINDILIIKLCDRTDNLKKRVQKNILSKNYINKSTELIQWIWDNYTGDKEKMKIFIEDNILLYIPKINKKIILD
jgi:hypothetical protein